MYVRGMEQILQAGMERGYGTRCGPGPCSGFYNLTCTPIIYIYIYIYHVLICIIHLTTMHGRFHPKLFL